MFRKKYKYALAVIVVSTGIGVWPAIGEELVTNGSFEELTGTVSQYDGKWQAFDASFYCPGWTAGGTGISTETDTTVWKDRSAPDGKNVCIFGSNKSMTQEFTVDAASAGPCWISFLYAARPDSSYSGGRFHVVIDDDYVGHVDCGSSTAFRPAIMVKDLSVGTHILVISNSNNHAALDAVSITPKRDLIFNGSFEEYAGTITGADNEGRWKAFDNDFKFYCPGWTAGGTGISTETDTTVWKDRSAPDGTNVCIFGNSKTMTQTFTVDADSAGPCLISFMYAVRTGYSGAVFHVKIDGVEVGIVECGSVTAFRRAIIETNLSVGEHTLVIGNGSINAVIDAVSITPKKDLIVNGSFDYGTVDANSGTYSRADEDAGHSNPGWTVTGRAGLAKPGYPSDAAWASGQLEGTGIYSLYIQTANYSGRELPPVSVSQTFNAAAPGVYELSFSYASRPFQSNSGGMIYARVYKGEGLEGELIWEKIVTATSLNAFQYFVGNLKLYEAGKYTLQFYAPQMEYIATGENNRCSVLDNVSLRFRAKLKGFIISFY